MKLSYLTPLTFPSKYGNRLQVIKMSAAFSRCVDFTLYIAEIKGSKGDVFRQYTIHDPFELEVVGKPRMWPRSYWQARKFLPIITVEDSQTVWYTRDVLLAFWLTFLSPKFRRNYFFELHTLSRFPRYIYHRILDNARGIITTNKHKKEDLIRLYNMSGDMILVAGNGIDNNEFAQLPPKEKAREELGISGAGPLVVYKGTMADSYGASIIKKAEHMLAGEMNIRIVTGQPREGILQYYDLAAADIVIAPYLNANDHFRYYMSPMKIREYMAIGRPIVVSDLPSTREILDDESAFFVEPGSARALVDMLRYVSEHPAEAEKRASRAHALAQALDWNIRAEQTVKFIKRTV